MDVTEVMGELERLGTEQNRKVYRRHGMTDPLFGVSFAHMNALEKRIKRDHELAEALWATGNADARTLAVTIADPERFTWDKLEAWLDGLRSPVLIDLLMKRIALKTPFARDAMARWTASNDEWIGRAGWTLLGLLATEDPSLPDSLFEERLSVIEASIHRARNRAREGMNSALISIGARNEPLRGKALTAARRIGKVEIDHGETNCKTPDATAYIEKIWARKPAAAPAAKPARGAAAKPAKAAAKPAKAAAKPAKAAAKPAKAAAKPAKAAAAKRA
ncbi:DNA alkylation repair protein [Sorangium sp. wiwo2]|uniref:DNA alkylation repair protein n=1 Tax=Sorangium atrum TaxID=2995308 RepID=A0ABT5BRX4_9BACT|nr:DNA alkylation repair protein [Sorangium aterium]MDC0676458.1 DNA alkylation repair protein [Sorangium aterium]